MPGMMSTRAGPMTFQLAKAWYTVFIGVNNGVRPNWFASEMEKICSDLSSLLRQSVHFLRQFDCSESPRVA